MWVLGSRRKRVELSARFGARTAWVMRSAVPSSTPQHSRGWLSFACAITASTTDASMVIATRSLERFDRDGDAHSAANAEGGYPVAKATGLQGVQQRRENSCAARPNRMPERDRPTVHVDLRRVHAELSNHRQRLRRERFVELEQIDGRCLKPGAIEYLSHGGDRPDAHHHRIDTGHRVCQHPRKRH